MNQGPSRKRLCEVEDLRRGALANRSEGEGRDDAGATRHWRRVEGHLGRRAGLGRLAAETLGSPKGFVVDHERLRLRTGDSLAVQRQPVVGERGVERDLEDEG